MAAEEFKADGRMVQLRVRPVKQNARSGLHVHK
jgi:hypothetical protein